MGMFRRKVLPGSSLGCQDASCCLHTPLPPGPLSAHIFLFFFFSSSTQRQCVQESFRGFSMLVILGDWATALCTEHNPWFWLKCMFWWWDGIKAGEIQTAIWAEGHPCWMAEDLRASEHHQQQAWPMNGHTGWKAATATASGTLKTRHTWAHAQRSQYMGVATHGKWKGWTGDEMGIENNPALTSFIFPALSTYWKKILQELHSNIAFI